MMEFVVLTDGTYSSFIQGGMTYTSTTGRFTVPIDGIYCIHVQVYHNEDSQHLGLVVI